MTTVEAPPPDAANLLKDVKRDVADALSNPDIASSLGASEMALTQHNRPVVSGELREIMELAYVFAASSYFTDIKTVAQAAVKMMIGRSLGLSDIAALSNVYLFEAKGKTVVIVGVHILAAKIKSSVRYRFKIVESTDKVCRIEFYEKGFLDLPGWTMIAEESETMTEAMQPGGPAMGKEGIKDNWKGYPKDMLYARTIARGFRRHCADLLAIAPYVREEFGPGELRPIVDVTPSPSTSTTPRQEPRRASETQTATAAVVSEVLPDPPVPAAAASRDDVIDVEQVVDVPPPPVATVTPKRGAGIYIESVTEGKKGPDFQLWKLRFSDGVVRVTLNAAIHEVAERAVAAAAPVSFEMGDGPHGKEVSVLEILR